MRLGQPGNRATGQLGNRATGAKRGQRGNRATAGERDVDTTFLPSYLPTFRPSDLPTFLTFLPSFLPTVPSYLSGDPYLWSKIGLCGSPLMRSALPVNEDHLIIVFFCCAEDLAPTETHARARASAASRLRAAAALPRPTPRHVARAMRSCSPSRTRQTRRCTRPKAWRSPPR